MYLSVRKLVQEKHIISVIQFLNFFLFVFFKYIICPVTLKTFQHLLIIDSDRVNSLAYSASHARKMLVCLLQRKGGVREGGWSRDVASILPPRGGSSGKWAGVQKNS